MCKRSNRGFVTVVYVKEAFTDQNHLLAKVLFSFLFNILHYFKAKTNFENSYDVENGSRYWRIDLVKFVEDSLMQNTSFQIF